MTVHKDANPRLYPVSGVTLFVVQGLQCDADGWPMVQNHLVMWSSHGS
jgi:hypothetical protein